MAVVASSPPTRTYMSSRLRNNSIIASCVAFRTGAVSRQNNPQDAQKGCPARPQRTKRRIVLVPYGEPLSDARTPLADVFRILLGALHNVVIIDRVVRSQTWCVYFVHVEDDDHSCLDVGLFLSRTLSQRNHAILTAQPAPEARDVPYKSIRPGTIHQPVE